MRKLSCKWPLRLTLFGFLPPIFYIFFRIGKPEIFNSTELAQKILGGVLISVAVWIVYGIACIFARNWANCGSCKFSEIMQNSDEIKCQLTGYTYPATYSCKKSNPKEGIIKNNSR